MTAAELRRDLSRRNLDWARALEHETTFSAAPAIIHAEQAEGGHGNFHPASWRRIQARSSWKRRLAKTYTAGRHMARRGDRWRGELECATSSDALLMNLFCYPGVLRRRELAAILGVPTGLSPSFGARASVPLLEDKVDRTEVDMQLGDLLLEAKLTETGFQTARPALLARYRDLKDVFTIEDLPRTASGEFESYQLLRGALAAHAFGCRFAVTIDDRRTDLLERWYAVLRAVRSCDLRSRLLLLSWQDLATAVPPSLQRFLVAKYGIVSAAAGRIGPA